MSHILTLNAGSSSLKFALYQKSDPPEEHARGRVERIGGEAVLKLDVLGQTHIQALSEPAARDHAGALSAALTALTSRVPSAQVTAVSHRVVHGGVHFQASTMVTETVLDQLSTLIPFAPLHQPHNIAGIKAAQVVFPDAQQIACFDTAFHRDQPFEADSYALPQRYHDAGIRRYGFHGLSYAYIAKTLAEIAPALHKGRVIVAHLGNGASMCALKNGRSVASTMGFTALDGLPMGTRCGQLDPGVVLYMLEQEQLSPAEVSDILYKKSGLLGLSGISRDMRVLLASDAPAAAQAISLYVARIRHETGALAAELQGLDAFIFCGGIGENAAKIRSDVCAGLGWLGLSLDEAKNASPSTPWISTPDSTVQVLVIPTNEEAMLAEAAQRLT